MSRTLPPFTPEGLLPPGEFALSLDELRASSLVVGPGEEAAASTWDVEWRRALVDRLRVMVEQLWQAGITEVYIDGSFVEDKDHPNDIDGYFECDLMRFASGQLEAELNGLDPAKSWTWDHKLRRAYRGSPKRQLPMWHAYRVELYPHFPGLIAGVDVHGNALEFPAWFRQRRSDGMPKGIVKIVR
jgi:hypothetical protein